MYVERMEDELIADAERYRRWVRDSRRRMVMEAPDVGPPTREYLERLGRLDAADREFALLLFKLKKPKAQRLRIAGAALAGPWVLTGAAHQRRL